MKTPPSQSLPARWRREAERFQDLGADAQARTLEWCARELEQAQREWELEALTLADAAKESEYSYSALQKHVASGTLENVGEEGSPRIRRCDLPRKPAKSRPGLSCPEPDLAGEALLRKLGG